VGTSRNSVVSGSDAAFGLIAVDSGGGLTNVIEGSTFSENGTPAVQAAGSNVTVRMRNSTATGNDGGLDNRGGAKLISNGGNVVR
jgi:hypothetical protein